LIVGRSQFRLGLVAVLVKRTFASMGALGIVASIIYVVSTTIAQKLVFSGVMQGNARVPVGFQNKPAMRTIYGLTLEQLLTART